ncbi:MAG: class I SAM-dependent methyltransferase [Deltaproteobacteria bacterium]|nr:class I SAM-dependent methyltransferase [Deltaproteobacteria bacterium]
MKKLTDLERDKWDLFWRHRKRNLWGILFDYLNVRIVFRDFAGIMRMYTSRGMVLEAGSGFSESTIFLGKTRGDAVFALDLSIDALKGADDFGRRNGVAVRTVCADLRGIPFKEKAFDLVFSGGVIEHFEDPVEIVREMKRIARTNIAVVPTDGLVWKLTKRIKKCIGEDKGITELPFQYYNQDYAHEVFREAGYTRIEVVKFTTMFFCPYLAIIGWE